MMNTTLQATREKSYEEAVVFGEDENLVGVYCDSQGCSDGDSFAAIMVTPGMLPSSGPYRMHVQLANRLAGVGIRSFRFDLSGIGESLAAGTPGSSLDRAAGEISAAIDHLHIEHGIQNVALFGLCSGADDALYAAQKDERIVGLFSVDGLGYRTWQYPLHRLIRNHLPKLLSRQVWARRFGARLGESSQVHDTLQPGFDIREFPERDQAAQQLQALVARGVSMHFHYTGGVSDYYNHAGQFRQMFQGTELSTSGNLDRITTSFHAASDHVGFLIEHREVLLQTATDWFGAVACKSR